MMTRSKRVANAISAVMSILQELDIDSNIEVLRAENNVVLGVNDGLIVKAVETERDAALHKEATILSALRDHDEAVNLHRSLEMPVSNDGWTAIFLERLHVDSTQPTRREMHESLHRLHVALDALSSHLDIVHWTDHLRRTAQAWESHPFLDEQQKIAERAYASFVTAAFEYNGPVQILHGDAWTGQILKTAEGLRWIDFETASVGPKEWDLAASDGIDGYGTFDHDLWERLKLVRSWSVAVWSNVNAQHSPQLKTHVDFHIERLSNALH
jgi:hypothetical protein